MMPASKNCQEGIDFEEVGRLSVAICYSKGFFLLILLVRSMLSLFSKNAFAIADSMKTHLCKAERPHSRHTFPVLLKITQ